MNLRVNFLLASGLILMLLVTGCSVGSGNVETLQITAVNMKYDTPEITVKRGQPLKVVLVNQDGVVHDLSIDHVEGTVKKQTRDVHAAHSDGGKTPDLHVSAAANGKGSIQFTPTATGTYEFYCAVDGHKEAGMIGRLIVQ